MILLARIFQPCHPSHDRLHEFMLTLEGLILAAFKSSPHGAARGLCRRSILRCLTWVWSTAHSASCS